jgi:hypothetical protein
MTIFRHFRTFDGIGCTSCQNELDSDGQLVTKGDLLKVMDMFDIDQQVCLQEISTHCAEHQGSQCTKCQDGYGIVLSDNGQVVCQAATFKCEEEFNELPFEQLTLQVQCSTCADGFHKSESGNQCLIDHCKEEDELGKCVSCLPGGYYILNEERTRCLDRTNFLYCESISDTSCTGCKYGLALAFDGTLWSCQEKTVAYCLEYEEDYRNIEPIGKPQCKECPEHFTLNAAKDKCEISNCTQEVDGLCHACHHDYVLHVEADNFEHPACVDVNDESLCTGDDCASTTCKDGNPFDAFLKYDSDGDLDIIDRCAWNFPGCATVDVPTIGMTATDLLSCDSCDTGYEEYTFTYNNYESGSSYPTIVQLCRVENCQEFQKNLGGFIISHKCAVCSDGYVLDEKLFTCSEIPNCAKVRDGVCMACEKGFSFQDTTTCTPVGTLSIDHCLEYQYENVGQTDDICRRCQDGYKPNDQKDGSFKCIGIACEGSTDCETCLNLPLETVVDDACPTALGLIDDGENLNNCKQILVSPEVDVEYMCQYCHDEFGLILKENTDDVWICHTYNEDENCLHILNGESQNNPNNLSLTENTQCGVCKDGFEFLPGYTKCLIEGCDTQEKNISTGLYHCTACKEGYQQDQDTLKCYQIERLEGETEDPEFFGCSQINSEGECTQCKDNTFSLVTRFVLENKAYKKTVRCQLGDISRCSAYQNTHPADDQDWTPQEWTQCQTCALGTFASLQKNDCLISNCSVDSNTTCEECLSGYVLSKTKEECVPADHLQENCKFMGKVIDQNNLEKFKCVECEEGFAIVEDVTNFAEEINFCQTYEVNTRLRNCETALGTNEGIQSFQQCLECKEGYKPNTISEDQAVREQFQCILQDCVTLDENTGDCLECEDGFLINEDHSVCVKISEGASGEHLQHCELIAADGLNCKRCASLYGIYKHPDTGHHVCDREPTEIVECQEVENDENEKPYPVCRQCRVLFEANDYLPKEREEWSHICRTENCKIYQWDFDAKKPRACQECEEDYLLSTDNVFCLDETQRDHCEEATEHQCTLCEDGYAMRLVNVFSHGEELVRNSCFKDPIPACASYVSDS